MSAAQCGSCAAFAATALSEFAYLDNAAAAGYTGTNSMNLLSEDDLLECTAQNQCNGAGLYQYLDMIACKGQANTTSRTPYDAMVRGVGDAAVSCPRAARLDINGPPNSH